MHEIWIFSATRQRQIDQIIFIILDIDKKQFVLCCVCCSWCSCWLAALIGIGDGEPLFSLGLSGRWSLTPLPYSTMCISKENGVNGVEHRVFFVVFLYFSDLWDRYRQWTDIFIRLQQKDKRTNNLHEMKHNNFLYIKCLECALLWL